MVMDGSSYRNQTGGGSTSPINVGIHPYVVTGRQGKKQYLRRGPKKNKKTSTEPIGQCITNRKDWSESIKHNPPTPRQRDKP